MLSNLFHKKLFVLIFAVEALVGGCALVYIVLTLWTKPLGPSLASHSIANAQEITNSVTSPISNTVGTSNHGLDPSVVITPTSTVTPSISILDQIGLLVKPVQEFGQTLASRSQCGGPHVMTLLVIGSDARGEGYLYGLGDTIRLVRVDFDTPSVMVVDIPRDLWVNIPGIADHYNITMGKLNQAYFFGNPGSGYYDGPGEGPGLMAETLKVNFGVEGIDHYLAMDRPTFASIVDAIGGVDIYLNGTIDLNAGRDGANPDYVLGPGSHHLTGELALKLALDRYPTTFERARNQNIVLRAIEKKALNPAMIPEIPGLINQFAKAVQTDLSASDISQLVCIEKKLTEDNIKLVAFPDTIFKADRTYDPYRKVYTSTLAVDNQVMRDYLDDFMNGIWPEN